MKRLVDNDVAPRQAVPEGRSGGSRRAYAQLAFLGAMVPVEAAVAAEWSLPMGALLMGGTLATGLTSEVISARLPIIRGFGVERRTAAGQPTTRLKLSVAPKGRIDLPTVEAALRRVCRGTDSVSAGNPGEFTISLPGCPTDRAVVVGSRIALAVENRMSPFAMVKIDVVSDVSPAALMKQAKAAQRVDDLADPYAIRRQILHGEPGRGGIAALLVRQARARLPLITPAAI